MAGRISREDKGKGLANDYYQAPRKPTIKAQAPDNSALLQKYSLTLIGRVTNQTAQKVWSLIPFFTELWKSDTRPVGADLGNGMFQFQFEKEADLLDVLEKRPYHFSRWMVIVQRWEPTVSKDFPSLIPFWIRVQGIPIHLWSEETVQDLGENLGVFEKLEITETSVKMRVQVNGLLPLIKSSVIEYSNGDEVTATFVYDKLERHCSKCFRLDHELRDCLIAKHQEREAKALELKNRAHTEETIPQDHHDKRRNGPEIYHFAATNPNGENYKRGRSYDARGHQYDARRTLEDRRRYRSSYETSNRGYTREPSKERQRSYDSRLSQMKEPSYRNKEISSRPPREEPDRRETTYHSPIQRGRSMTRREEQNRTKESSTNSGRLERNKGREPHIPTEALNEAREEVREAMLQYTQVADPTESAARRERMRLATEKMEKSAMRIATKAIRMEAEEGGSETQRSIERIPAALRLGPPLTYQNTEEMDTNEAVSHELEVSAGRIPASQRLGTPNVHQEETGEPLVAPRKRKPGRPPGVRKVQQSPKQNIGSSSRKRKMQQAKPPTTRRRITTMGGKEKKRNTRARASSSQEAGTSTNSDNQPICNMIPASSKRRMDFQNPSPLGP